MKKIAIILSVLCLTSCIKEQVYKPLTNDLTGVWLSDNKEMQFTIHDTQGRGNAVTYTDIKNDNGRFLVINAGGTVSNYQILSVSAVDLNLSDRGALTHLTKISEW